VENSQIIALVAIGISVVSIGLIVANNSSFQSTLFNLDTRIIEQSQSIKSINEQLNSSQQATSAQSQTIQSLSSQLNSNQQTVSEQKQAIDQINENVTLLTNEIRSLEDKVASLEQGTNQQSIQPPPQTSQSTTFVPVALQDNTGTYWTSWFIKESLYYPTLYSTSCDAPSVDCYVHMSNISTPNGTGIEADTIGSTVYGYWFLGYSEEYVVPDNGTVTISGNFFKNDTFGQPDMLPLHTGISTPTPTGSEELDTHPPANLTLPSYQTNMSVPEGRSHIFVFILDRDPNIILQQKEAVTSSDNHTTWYHRTVTFSLPPGQVFRVGIGAENDWATDWNVYVAWNGVTINATPAWSPVQ
jgi:uncharacterized coiled-coil protein SlyX